MLYAHSQSMFYERCLIQLWMEINSPTFIYHRVFLLRITCIIYLKVFSPEYLIVFVIIETLCRELWSWFKIVWTLFTIGKKCNARFTCSIHENLDRVWKLFENQETTLRTFLTLDISRTSSLKILNYFTSDIRAYHIVLGLSRQRSASTLFCTKIYLDYIIYHTYNHRRNIPHDQIVLNSSWSWRSVLNEPSVMTLFASWV